MSSVCNRDCFNCIYPDCIANDVTAEEREDIRRREMEARLVRDRLNPKPQKPKSPETLAKMSKWRREHPEYSREYYRRRVEADPGYRERLNAQNRAWWARQRRSKWEAWREEHGGDHVQGPK